jgi:plasmid stabilization system protein ParE
MVNKYILRYLPAAVDDLISIFDWIAGDSPANAAAFIEKIDQRIGSLKIHPFLGRIPRDDKLRLSRPCRRFLPCILHRTWQNR